MARMRIARGLLIGAAVILAASAAEGQDQPAPAATPAQSTADAAPIAGKALLSGKCFQCHNDAMFRDQRQDRRAWEATLYRMVGRGALWTKDEINAMADYLGTDYGPQAPKAAAQR